MIQFLNDVLAGLRNEPKRLDSKYFYNEEGDRLFQQIMALPEYYLTNCEMEILQSQKKEIAKKVLGYACPLDLVELGPGDAAKSIFLIKEFYSRGALNHFYPIDISQNITDHLNEKLPALVPGLEIRAINGEYFESLGNLKSDPLTKKLVLFLGANIGNIPLEKADSFYKKLHSLLSDGDLVLTGFDLKKHPKKILTAYDDASGVTAQFNLNLLRRINTELGADFILDQFEHYAQYDPVSGACKSYLVSLQKQEVRLHDSVINFERDECILVEVSQKYSLMQIDALAETSGFETVEHFFDSKKYFSDVLWICRK